jgi:Transposase DDE domain
LVSKGTLHDKKDRHGGITHQYQLYRAQLTDCRNCPFNEKCVIQSQLDRGHGRTIERSENEETVEENDARYNTHEGKAIYKRRQAMVEHPFGTIKRSWGYSYTLLKGIEKVTAEFAFVATSYNMRRAVSIIGVKSLIMKLKCEKNTFWQHQIAIFALIVRHVNSFTKKQPLTSFDNLTRLKQRYQNAEKTGEKGTFDQWEKGFFHSLRSVQEKKIRSSLNQKEVKNDPFNMLKRKVFPIFWAN